jgi:branched-chain amino acid transport system substrate-binding protein
MRNPYRACRALLAGAAVAGSVVGLLAVSGSASASSSKSTKFAGTISIGFINDLSGLYDSIGYPAGAGAQVAVNLVNSNGGIDVGGKKYRLNLVTCEANSDSAQAVACAQKLIRVDGLKFIMGGTGPEAPPVAAITAPAGVIYTNPSTALTQVMSKYPDVYNPLDGLDLKIQLAAKSIKQTFPKAKTFAAVYADDPTDAAFPVFVADLKKEGIRLVKTEVYSTTALDVTPQLTAAKAAHPDLVFLGWTEAEVAPAIKANQTLNVAPDLYGWTGPGACTAYKSQLGSAKFLSSELFGEDLAFPTNAVAKQYVAAYKKFVRTSAGGSYRSPVDIPNMTYSLLYADAIPLLAQAIARAGTFTDVPKITAALKTTSIGGIQGVVKYGANRSVQMQQESCTNNLTGHGSTSVFSVAP